MSDAKTKVVPVEPTPGMKQAVAGILDKEGIKAPYVLARELIRAALSAAPQPASDVPQDAEQEALAMGWRWRDDWPYYGQWVIDIPEAHWTGRSEDDCGTYTAPTAAKAVAFSARYITPALASRPSPAPAEGVAEPAYFAVFAGEDLVEVFDDEEKATESLIGDRVVRPLYAIPEPATSDALAEENARLRKALRKIAAFDDQAASAELMVCNSYSAFDEPNSVRVARAALANPAPASDVPQDVVGALRADDMRTADAAWDELINKDDRNSPEEYPEMALITYDELADFMDRALASRSSPAPAEGVAGPVAIKDAKRAVKMLGALLSSKPHRCEPDLANHYFEWVQRVERAHADIRDALANPAPATSTDALAGEVERLREAAKAILAAETVTVHVGYDDAPGGGNFVYADAIRTDDEAFAKLRAALSPTTR